MVFLDRDGVLNELVFDPASGTDESPLRARDVRLVPGVLEALRRLQGAGYLLAGVTNQPAAAKGRMPVGEVMAIHSRLVTLLAGGGVALDDWEICLHHPEGTDAALARACDCRKPAPGMLLAAARKLSADMTLSWMIGDTDADIEAGVAAGCRTVLVETPASAHKRGGIAPSLRVGDIAEAVELILRDRP